MSGLTYGEHGRCTAHARSAGRRCRRPAVGAHGKCDKHGGASTGPRDTTALEGNNHAEGNAGGGAPEGNTNAVTYGAWCDWRKAYDRLSGDARSEVDELTESHIEHAKANLPSGLIEEKARELAMRHYLWRRATLQTSEEGLILEEERDLGEITVQTSKANPGLTANVRHSRRQRQLMTELQLWPTPDGRPASEW